jgi:hypothetical protein
LISRYLMKSRLASMSTQARTGSERSRPERPGTTVGTDTGQADDVDRIVEAWRRERPDLDVSPLQVLSRVSRLARRLDLARGSAFAEYGLEGWEFDVLSALRRAGRPYELSPGQLVQQTLVTSALADLLQRERDLLSELPENERRNLSDLLKRLLVPLES